jgi:thioredoxin reductase
MMSVGAAPYASLYVYRQLLLLKFLQGFYLPREGEPGFPTLQHNPAYTVELLTETRLNEVRAGSILVSDKEGAETVLETDSVFIAWERVPNGELYEELFGKVPELYVIGDAKTPRTSWYAVHDGASVALEL